jgi:hypothetical protein
MMLGTADPIEPELVRQLDVGHATGDDVNRVLGVKEAVRHWPARNSLAHGTVRKADEKRRLHQAAGLRISNW